MGDVLILKTSHLAVCQNDAKGCRVVSATAGV